MSNLKKYIDIVTEASNWKPSDPMDTEPRHDHRAGDRQTLRQEMFGYLEDAQQAIDEGNFDQAKEYIGYVIELVDDNV
jgi:hypothetical protein